jgi:hypothetical protein
MVLDSPGNIYVVWTGSGFPGGIYFCRSNNNGTSWVNPVRVYNSQSFSTRKSCITVNQAGNLYVVFEEYIGDMDSISLKSTGSTDNGLNWSPPVEIYNEGIFNKRYPHRLFPFITADNDGNIYAFWYSVSISPLELAVYFSRLDNTGTTWSQPLEIPYDFAMEAFNMTVDNTGNLYIAIFYYGQDAANIYFSRSNQ